VTKSGFGRTAILLLVAACASTPSQSPRTGSPTAEAPQAVKPEPDYSAWETATRARVDEIISEAEQLAADGDPDGAVTCLHHALAMTLDAPEGYPARTVYLDFVAAILTEIEALEADLEPLPEPDVPLELLATVTDDVEVEDTPPTDLDGLPESDFPLLRNSQVDRFLAAIEQPTELRQRIVRGMERAGPYLPMIREVMARSGLPADLAYLPLIESAYSLTATSRARAHGMWQFMAGTGRHYGLAIDRLLDERRDPVRSTEAAAAYLADLHAQLHDWHLALAAYNSGAGNVRRAIRRTGSRDFWVLRRRLPRETRNYVPAFIAAVIAVKQAARYDLDPIDERPWTQEEVSVPDAVDLEFLAAGLELPVSELRRLNPAVRRDITPPGRTTRLHVPSGASARAEEILAGAPRSEWAPRVMYAVRSGDSLYTIARKYGSSVGAIRSANRLSSNLIRPGQTLIIPRLGFETAPTTRRSTEDGSYVVRRSDTLWDIARAFNVSVAALQSANGIGPSVVIHPGQRLHIPPSATTRPHSDTTTKTTSDSYRVRSGDTLYGIARRFNISVASLKQANGLTDTRIHPGEVLRIPAEG